MGIGVGAGSFMESMLQTLGPALRTKFTEKASADANSKATLLHGLIQTAIKDPTVTSSPEFEKALTSLGANKDAAKMMTELFTKLGQSPENQVKSTLGENLVAPNAPEKLTAAGATGTGSLISPGPNQDAYKTAIDTSTKPNAATLSARMNKMAPRDIGLALGPTIGSLQAESIKAGKSTSKFIKLPKGDMEIPAIMAVDPEGNVQISPIPGYGGPRKSLVTINQGPAAPSPQERTQIAGTESQLGILNDIEKAMKAGGASILGPAAGVLAGASADYIGGLGLGDKQAELVTQTANLRNETLRLLAGTTVSAAEEKRIRTQLPDLTNREPLFRTRLAQTRKNLIRLQQLRLKTLKGSGVRNIPDMTTGAYEGMPGVDAQGKLATPMPSDTGTTKGGVQYRILPSP